MHHKTTFIGSAHTHHVVERQFFALLYVSSGEEGDAR